MSAFDELDQRFTSGNDVNVGSIHLSRELYERLSAENKHNNVAMSQMSKAQLQNYNMATKSWDEATRLRQQLADIELIANEIEQLFVDGDNMKLMSLVPLGKIVRLKQSIAQIRELEK